MFLSGIFRLLECCLRGFRFSEPKTPRTNFDNFPNAMLTVFQVGNVGELMHLNKWRNEEMDGQMEGEMKKWREEGMDGGREGEISRCAKYMIFDYLSLWLFLLVGVIDWLTNWTIGWLIDWPTDRPTDRPTYWLINWLIDWNLNAVKKHQLNLLMIRTLVLRQSWLAC